MTNNQYMQLLGLQALARMHNKAMEEISNAVQELTGEKDAFGYSNDFVYNDESVAWLLNGLKIKVEK